MDNKTADIIAAGESRARSLDEESLAWLLSLEDSSDGENALFEAAYRVKRAVIGKKVSIRALIEAGNACAKDCRYCGIRKSNARIERYTMSAEEIYLAAMAAKEAGYASIVVQAGEIESPAHTARIEEALKAVSALDMGVTLSLGEQEEEVYRRWREAGATRYLLRIETSDPRLYARLHPADHSWQRRAGCLGILSRLGYQVGTGVMCALPGQDAHSLARDILFYAKADADMIGMGPYIPHRDAPVPEAPAFSPDARLHLALRMIAATRLMLHDVNIASTTALEALSPDGRERGVLAGANVIMPNITDSASSSKYRLYDGKPFSKGAAGAAESLKCIARRFARLGEKVLFNERGDSLHYAKKSGSNQ
ncbi:MAG: [FeFe] hydrogenase H-cluster radical SAM maturase HydE [Kiritimatiellae bacterium]|nr:[FeFe] hydrogenase H-cluster radical SAM maturase HydE [Kiritimatiellia bacterium]